MTSTLAPHQLLKSSKSNEWYTPAYIADAAREVMGGIDLDPASNPLANETIKATNFYTIEDDGLTAPWQGRLFLNPPYGKNAGNSKGNQALWSDRLITEYLLFKVEQAILLVNASTDCKWFQRLWNYPICFTDHRVKFYTPNGTGESPTMGSALVYFGPNGDRFDDVFSQFGAVVARRHR